MKRLKQSGFTLVELLITMMIIGLTVGSIASIFISIQTVQHRTTYNDQAIRADQRIIEYWRSIGPAAIPNGNTDFSSLLPPASLPPGATAIATVTTPAAYPELRNVTATITYTTGSTARTVVLSALIGKFGVPS